MNKSQRMQFKAAMVLMGVFFLFLLVIAGIVIKTDRKEQPEGEYIKMRDVQILLDAADIKHGTYGAEYLIFEEVVADFGGIAGLQESISELEKKYKNEHMVLKEDWFSLYDMALIEKGLTEQINRIGIVSLGAGVELTDASGKLMPENVLITEDKEYAFVSPDFLQYRFVPVTVYQKSGTLLTVYEQTEEKYQIFNAWVMETAPEYFLFFWNDYEIRIDFELNTQSQNATHVSEKAREQVADICFENGIISEVNVKPEKVTGKILNMDEHNISIDGVGTLPFSDNLKVYQIYDKIVRKYTGDLRIGYSFTDFVIQDGKVEACLITRDEAMENIRVLINNSNYGGRFHEIITASADTDFVVRYGSYDNLQEQIFKAGEIVEFGMESAYFIGDRITIVPQALTGKVQLLSVERSQGIPQYRGTIEILKTADGLAVINEVLLEEYLYSVVPSEMPASYPLEALKAQAVCARTYAYRKMLNSGLSAYGVHLDDSTSYQVYNNIKENVATTKAVRETKGELLYVEDALVDAYYYSTSCGFGTTADIWKSGSPAPEYLKAKRIGSVSADETLNETALMDEDAFSTYIENVYDSDYDSSEGWYRWNYIVEKADAELIASRMQERHKANKRLVLKRTKNDTVVINEIDVFTKIYDITCGQRGPGGVLDNLIIETDCGIYQVIGEYNIRYVLNNGETMVRKQDGVDVASPTLLPSAFFVMEVIKDGEYVTGYEINGGGYGHGVGMSQNGAKHMAEAGMNSEKILTFFYDGSAVHSVY